MEYSESGPSVVSSSQSPTVYRERTGSVAAGQANYESSSSSGVGNSRSRERDSPPPIARSSTESSLQHPSKDYLPNVQLIRRDSISDTREGTQEELVPTSFDESAIRVLCDMDNGVQCMLDRIKQSMASCREASIFLKKRAVLEEDFGRTMHKLAATSQMAYTANECKAGSFATAWEKSMKIHEVMADNRMRFASTLNEMSEDLNNLAKEVDKTRKQTKELHTRFERQLMEADTSYEKARQRVELTNEDLERVLVAKEGESMKEAQMSPRGGTPKRTGLTKAVARSGLLLKGKNPGSIQRQEEDVRTRMSSASTAFERARGDFKVLRQDYFTNQLPRIIRALKECADEIDTGMQFHLTRYAFLFETVVLNDGVTLVPNSSEDGPGLKPTMESIDNRGDFRSFVQNYRVAHAGDIPRGPRREDPREERYIPQHVPYDRMISNTLHGNGGGLRSPTFGVPLGDQMIRDQVEVPRVVVKGCDAVEKYGLSLQGIYRIPGTVTKVQELKRRLDLNVDAVNLDDEEWTQDINIVAGVLKQWFRELPEPLLPPHQYHAFMEAARNESKRLRHIRMHENVNALPDPNYATLKHLMGHLRIVVDHQDENSMDIKNIAIVFAPSLFGAPGMPGATQVANGTNPGTISDVGLQQKAIETILEHYVDIFVEEPQEG